MTHRYHRPDIESEDMAITEQQLSNDLCRLLNSKSVVIDVGANHGQFALQITALISIEKMYCFEPLPDAYSKLTSISRQHKEIIPICKAISIENGTTSFYVTASDVGSSLLKPLPEQPSKWLTLEQEIQVKTQRLDSFLNSYFPGNEKKIALLKSDAQGADLDVLRSAGVYLKPAHINAVLVEINFHDFYQNQQPYHEIFGLLDNSGYRMARMYPHRAHDEWLWWADVLFIGK
jgi:FkbM family methyltransferase